jgi:hypothetical protein
MADIEVREEGRIILGIWRQDVSMAEGMINIVFIRSNNYAKVASAVRDRYTFLPQAWFHGSGKRFGYLL